MLRECSSLFCKQRHSSVLMSVVRTIVKRKYPVKPDDRPASEVPELTYTHGGNAAATQVYVWGLNEHGALGIMRQLKDKRQNRVPRFLHRPCRLSFAEKFKVTDVACGYGFSLMAVHSKNSQKVYGMGINTDSQLGYQVQRRDAPMGLLLAPAPVELPVPPSSQVTALAAGRAHSLVLVEEHRGTGGKVLSLGNNAHGQCGRHVIENEDYSGSRTVHTIGQLDGAPIKSISCGQDHSVLINTRGEVFACGWGADGQTGQGHYDSVSKPSRVRGDIENEKIVKVATTADCNLAINDKGELFGWGNSEYGQLLMGACTQLHTPRHLQIPEVGKVVDAAAAGSFCAVLNARGEVWVWGFGMLGLGPEVTRMLKPSRIPPPLFGHNELSPSGYRIKSLNSGLFCLTALSSHGDLYTWGRNKDACLGLGHSEDQPFPLRVSIGAQVTKISCGVDHMAVICQPFSIV